MRLAGKQKSNMVLVPNDLIQKMFSLILGWIYLAGIARISIKIKRIIKISKNTFDWQIVVRRLYSFENYWLWKSNSK